MIINSEYQIIPPCIVWYSPGHLPVRHPLQCRFSFSPTPLSSLASLFRCKDQSFQFTLKNKCRVCWVRSDLFCGFYFQVFPPFMFSNSHVCLALRLTMNAPMTPAGRRSKCSVPPIGGFSPLTPPHHRRLRPPTSCHPLLSHPSHCPR